MSSYGRNFDFRIVPDEDDRLGRIVLSQGADVPIGAPLRVADGAVEDVAFTNALPAQLATGAQAPKPGMSGIGIYEWIDFNQFDPLYTTYSDRDLMPDTRLVQLIVGPGSKVVFRNTTARTFMGSRHYPGRTMVAGMGATPTVTVGDYLTPGVGTDVGGYWAETATASEAWLVVTAVDASRQEVEAILL